MDLVKPGGPDGPRPHMVICMQIDLVDLIAQVDQICGGTSGPSGPGKPHRVDGTAAEWTLDYIPWNSGGPYSIKWTRLKGYRWTR